MLFLSHWHWDHSGGITSVVAAIAEARDRAGLAPLIVDVHPDRPDQRGILTPFDNFAMLPPDPTIEAIEAAGGTVAAHADEHSVGDLFSPAATSHAKRATKPGCPDTTAGVAIGHADRLSTTSASSARRAGQGTTVFTACSHAGVVNVGLEMRRLLPDQPIGLLLGGFHLAGATVEDRIDPTVARPRRTRQPRIVAPGHCTGWRGATALVNTFGPTRMAPSVVGTRYLINAS